jgi:kumamolisin
LAGSTLSREGEEHWVSAADPDQQIVATIVLRRRASAANLGEELLAGAVHPLSREEGAEIGADPQDMAAVRAFVDANGFRILNENAAARTIRIEGTIQQMDRAFGVQMAWFENAQGERFLSYRGTISIPESLGGIIMAVLGLDERPAARRRC